MLGKPSGLAPPKRDLCIPSDIGWQACGLSAKALSPQQTPIAREKTESFSSVLILSKAFKHMFAFWHLLSNERLNTNEHYSKTFCKDQQQKSFQQNIPITYLSYTKQLDRLKKRNHYLARIPPAKT